MNEYVVVSEDKLPQLLLALVNHGFGIYPRLSPVEDGASIERFREMYTHLNWSLFYQTGDDPSDFQALHYVGYFDPTQGGPSEGRLEIMYSDDAPPEVLHYLFLALKAVGLREKPFQ
jgi:hypothetical protein